MFPAISNVTIIGINSMRGWEGAPHRFHQTTTCVAEGLLAPRHGRAAGAAASASGVSGLDPRDSSSWVSFGFPTVKFAISLCI